MKRELYEHLGRAARRAVPPGCAQSDPKSGTGTGGCLHARNLGHRPDATYRCWGSAVIASSLIAAVPSSRDCRFHAIKQTISPGQSHAVVRSLAGRRDQDRRWLAMPLPWRCLAGWPAARPARPHTEPVLPSARRRRPASALPGCDDRAVKRTGAASSGQRAQRGGVCGSMARRPTCGAVSRLAFSVGHRPFAD